MKTFFLPPQHPTIPSSFHQFLFLPSLFDVFFFLSFILEFLFFIVNYCFFFFLSFLFLSFMGMFGYFFFCIFLYISRIRCLNYILSRWFERFVKSWWYFQIPQELTRISYMSRVQYNHIYFKFSSKLKYVVNSSPPSPFSLLIYLFVCSSFPFHFL